MSGYAELRDMGVQFGPFDSTPPTGAHGWDRFAASWSTTCNLLARELRYLDAKSIVCELDLSPEDFRIDGLPRANARPYSPAVRVTFTSKWGPLRYETAEFDSWQANVRAIALSMEALRKVDRYGVSKRGEQYTGWRQLASGTTPEDAIVTREQAMETIRVAAGVSHALDPDWNLDSAVKLALRKAHPDLPGGSDEAFRKVQKAREVLGV